MTAAASTASLCPHCLRRVPALRVRNGNAVYLERSCPDHGAIDPVLLWKDEPWTYEEWTRRTKERTECDGPADCPSGCGICSGHQQETCTAVLEVTSRCDLNCPLCFAMSGPAQPGDDPDLQQIGEMLRRVKEHAGSCPLQISGGEPALREDLPQIIGIARTMGFDHVQINTNGLRLAEDPDFARSIKSAGATDVFLQFDGLTDEAYQRLRGAALLSRKLQAVERCADAKIGVILVPTLVKNVNDSQIGALVGFAKRWIPTVKGIHFQPAAYLGRYPAMPRNEDRMLISDILIALEEQTSGELRIENMLPSG